jgi:HSP90 family molecular chaperone
MSDSTEAPSTPQGAETLQFQAEVQQLLRILVHSLYTQKEIFLRELVSNAVDALDKMRFVQLTEKAGEDVPLEIRIELDEAKGRLSVTDTGIGMTRDELVENIGTIARSGTAQFLRQLSEEARKDSALIGQFGVGFYSVFMVAERVRLITRSWKSGSGTLVWESDGTGSYTISEHAESSRGTRIEVDLKPEEREFARPSRVREIVRQHSHYVPYPIRLGGDVINEVAALWTRPRAEITKADYDEFYQFITGRDEEPLSTLHFSLDTPVQMQALLYVPSRSFELLGFTKTEPSLGLYSRRVLIQAESKELVPDYLRFLRGLVDSEDLPLNVSRESFQHNRVIKTIRKQVVRKVLAHLAELSEKEPETYAKFFHEHGRLLKEGYQVEAENREKLLPLLRYSSTRSEGAEADVSLAQYVGRMAEDQKEIYYLSGTDRASLLRSPHLEVFRKKDIEVLLATDPLDDLLFSGLQSHEGRPLRSADEAGVDLKVDEGEEEPLAYRSKLGRLVERMKQVLGERVLDVRESRRLAQSPCALVNPQESAAAGLQKLMSLMNKDFVPSKRILEVNGRSPVIRHLAEVQHRDEGSALVERAAHQLLDSAMLLEGLPVSADEMAARMQETLSELAALKAAAEE